MTRRSADCNPRSGSDIETGEIQEPLLQTRLDEIRQDVSASKSTWADLRQHYPPEKSCFEPLNFSVSSWSALTSGDATGLGDDVDADQAYSQAATMAAYGVDILSRALNGPTVDRELTEQANKLFATLCATLMDTRDRHRNSVTKAVSEKVGAFVCILDKLDSSPPTVDISNHTMSLEQGELTINSLEEQRLDKAEKLDVPVTPHSKRHMSRSSTRDVRHPHSRGRSRSPNFQQPQQLQNHDTAGHSLTGPWPYYHLPYIGSSTQYSAPKPVAPNHPPAGSNARRVGADVLDSCLVTNHPAAAIYREGRRRTV